VDEARIQEIVERVLARIGDVPASPAEAVRNPPPGYTTSGSEPASGPASGPLSARRRDVDIPRGRRGVFPDVDAAVRAARTAWQQNESSSLEARTRWVTAMRETARAHVNELARHAVAETGYGRVDDKIQKNLLCINKTPGPEMLRPVAFSGDDGLTIIERASYGVIGSITPTTNPTETVINNGIGMVSGGNAVVFNVHPYAARVSAWFVHLLNEAIVGAGGPENLLTCVEKPTIESACWW
jgi:acyl-CoA reductase-like NAD-dependent aldehyde dehydrogenase